MCGRISPVPLPAGRGTQLEDTLQFMVLKEYLRMEEVPGIPALEKTPAYISYAPVETAPFRRDLILIAAKPAAAMLIYETALRSRAGAALAARYASSSGQITTSCRAE